MPQAPSPTAGMDLVLGDLGLTARCSEQIGACRLVLQPRLQGDGLGLSRRSDQFVAEVVLSCHRPHVRDRRSCSGCDGAHRQLHCANVLATSLTRRHRSLRQLTQN